MFPENSQNWKTEKTAFHYLFAPWPQKKGPFTCFLFNLHHWCLNHVILLLIFFKLSPFYLIFYIILILIDFFLNIHNFTWYFLNYPCFTWCFLKYPNFTWFFLNCPNFNWFWILKIQIPWIPWNRLHFTNLPHPCHATPNLPVKQVVIVVVKSERKFPFW